MKVGFAVAVGVAYAVFGDAGHARAEEPQFLRQECARKAQAAAAELRAVAIALEAEAAYAKAHGGAFSPQLTQEFVQWYQAEGGKAGSDLPELWRTDLTLDEAGRRQAAVDRFLRERSDRYRTNLVRIQRETAKGCPALELSTPRD